MGLINSVKGKVLETVVNKVSASEPKTTVLGFILAGVVAANVDYGKLIQKDPQQIGNVIAAVVVALIGWYTNNSKKS